MTGVDIQIVGEHWRFSGGGRRGPPTTGKAGKVWHGIVLILVPDPRASTHELRLRLVCRPHRYAAHIPGGEPPTGAKVCGRCHHLLRRRRAEVSESG